jgi:diacylglycerol diphosphate phosphatase/phosphatidate phosphatase
MGTTNNTFIAALLVAISRVQDYRHAGIDVTWTAIIGIAFAAFACLQYYLSLTSQNSRIPHPPRDFCTWSPTLREGRKKLGT